MKILLVLSFFVAAVFAGVGRLTSQQEEDAIRLYRSLCSNQQVGGSNGDTFVYCEYGIDPPQQIFREHEVRSDGVGTTSQQVVFVRPQPKIYNHQITLTGTSEHNQNTTIYVLPQKDQQEIAVNDQRVVTSKGKTPTLYYLSRDPHGNDRNQQEFSQSPITSSIRDNEDFPPLSPSKIVSSNFDDRDFRPAFSSSPKVTNFDDRDFRSKFSQSAISSSSSKDQGLDNTQITFTTDE